MIKEISRLTSGLRTLLEADDYGFQLAQTWDRQWLPENAILEPKLDGMRGVIIINDDGSYKAISRLNNPVYNVGHVAKELAGAKGYAIDGEFVARDWASTVSAIRSKEKGDTSVRFAAFDAIPLSDFRARKSPVPLKARKRLLQQLVPAGAKYVHAIEGVVVKTPEDVEKNAKKFVEQGYEGAMLKDLDAPYDFKRSKAWVKIKDFISDEFPIVGFAEGLGRLRGTLGAVMVKGHNGKVSGVGSGFSDQLRSDIWNNKDKYTGKMVEVKYQQLTPEGKLRMPTFHRFRPDKEAPAKKAEQRVERSKIAKVFERLTTEFGKSAELLPAGSFRRGEENSKDLDIVPDVKDQAAFDATLARLFGGKRTGDYDGVKVEIYRPGKNPKFTQWVWTGNKKYRISMHARAKAKGYKLNAYGLWKDDRLVSTSIEDAARLLHTPILAPSEMRKSSPSLPD